MGPLQQLFCERLFQGECSFSLVHKKNMFYKMHLLRRMGKCNGGANERVSRSRVFVRHKTEALTLRANVCGRR